MVTKKVITNLGNLKERRVVHYLLIILMIIYELFWLVEL
jgi:hypothetical protein